MLKGDHNYDILANPAYSDKYCYIACSMPNRSQFAISRKAEQEEKKLSLDLVRIAVDLPYLPKSVARDLNFNDLERMRDPTRRAENLMN